MNEKAQRVYDKVQTALHSSRGKDVLLYLLFVAVAFVFWVFLSLDTEVQRDFEIPFELQDVPDSVTVIGQVPTELGVSVKGKDSQLLRHMWGKMSPVKFKWEENITDNTFLLTHAKIEARLRDYFGAGIQIVSYRPDSVSVTYTTLPGTKVKLNVQADIHPNLQYIISGPIRANVDSVTLYSPTDLPHSLKFVSTEPVVKSELKDTMRYEVRVKPIAGVRIVPDKVVVTIPIEPLISRKRTIKLDVVNRPEDKGLITFPSKVEISYLVPMSAYNDDYPVKAYVDYNDIKPQRKKLPVSLSVIPDVYHNLSFSPDSVEYIIENK
ncbi:MAG: hypothetical protein HFJ95_01030 [Muribaculaceae bacterium]|nr:hypothetical protein [Muribaculaceae bacterium]